MVHRAVDLGNSEEEWEVCKLEGTASIYQRLGSWHSRRQSSSVLIHCTLPGSKGGPPGSKGPHPEVKVLHSEVKVLHSEVKVLCCVEERAGAGDAGKVINITNCMYEKWESEEDVRVNTPVKQIFVVIYFLVLPSKYSRMIEREG